MFGTLIFVILFLSFSFLKLVPHGYKGNNYSYNLYPASSILFPFIISHSWVKVKYQHRNSSFSIRGRIFSSFLTVIALLKTIKIDFRFLSFSYKTFAFKVNDLESAVNILVIDYFDANSYQILHWICSVLQLASHLISNLTFEIALI